MSGSGGDSQAARQSTCLLWPLSMAHISAPAAPGPALPSLKQNCCKIMLNEKHKVIQAATQSQSERVSVRKRGRRRGDALDAGMGTHWHIPHPPHPHCAHDVSIPALLYSMLVRILRVIVTHIHFAFIQLEGKVEVAVEVEAPLEDRRPTTSTACNTFGVGSCCFCCCFYFGINWVSDSFTVKAKWCNNQTCFLIPETVNRLKRTIQAALTEVKS